MHPEVLQWVNHCKELHPDYFRDSTVLEVGSRDLNGSVRALFQDCRYTGIDIFPGPGVDRVCRASDLTAEPLRFKTVVSCEMLEHSSTWVKDLLSMYELLEPEGLMIVTCAGPHTGAHNVEECGGYYGVRTETDIRFVLKTEKLVFDHFVPAHQRWPGGGGIDLRFLCLKGTFDRT